MWYSFSNNFEIRNVDPDEEWEDVDQADQVFKNETINYGRNKNITQIARENGVVIGALASGWDKDSGYGEDVMVFQFDVVVNPQFRRKGVGLQLIQSAIKQYNQDKKEYQDMGIKTMMRVWVVNPILISVLEKLGFVIESSYEHGENGQFGSAHLIAY